MKVVSVINYKGGVGKTTLTANLGAYAASQGKRVLMIDLDPQTHLTFSFMTPEYWGRHYADTKTLKNYFERVTRDDDDLLPLSELIIPLRPGSTLDYDYDNMKLDLVSSHLELINIDIELSALMSAPTTLMVASRFLKGYSYLRKELEKLEDEYDLVLLDCPPNFYVMVKNAIVASDYYIVPARPDYLSTLGVSELKKKIDAHLTEYEEHARQYNKAVEDNRMKKYKPVFLTLLGIVPMMVNIQKGDNPVSVQQEYINIMSSDGSHIFHFVRNNPSVFGSAPQDGIPAVLTRPRFNLTAKRIVKELRLLGDEILSSIYKD